MSIAAGTKPNSKSNNLYNEILLKSLFTGRQMSIIYKRAIKQSNQESISAGAYYRQLKQCRLKIKSVLYSVLLLRLCGAIDNEAINTLEKLGLRLDVISHVSIDSDVAKNQTIQDIIPVINKLIDKMCKV
jgi:hypothetical protein